MPDTFTPLGSLAWTICRCREMRHYTPRGVLRIPSQLTISVPRLLLSNRWLRFIWMGGERLTHRTRWPLLLVLCALATVLHATDRLAQTQEPSLTVLMDNGHQTLAVARVNDRQMVALGELATVFGLSVREDTLADGLTVTYRDQVVVLTATQELASVGGRVVSLPSPPVRTSRGWYVPIEFLNRVLGLVINSSIELRQRSGLVIVGDLRVPTVDVRYTVGRGQAQIIFEVTPPAPYTIEEDQQHLLLKFDAEALDLSLPEIGSDSLVNSIQRGNEPSWLTINLGSEYASFQSVLLNSVTGTSNLLVSILSAGVANEITAASTPSRPSVSETTPALPELTVPAMVRTIVLDPGHGGDDHGVVGPNGVLEKHVTLQVAERLQRAIESRLGLRVVMTRNDDRMVRLDERAAIANNNKADLFISLHANAALSPVPVGASVSYLSLDDAGGTSREGSGNRSVSVLGGGSRNIEAVSWEMAQISHIDQSAMFAAIVDAQLRTRVDVRPSESQGAPFRVLVGANMPAVLVELGFLSNPNEEQKLASASFQETLVQALFQSIVGFRVRVEQPIRPEADNAFWEEP